ncbi:MAG: AAA family ATPase [Phycisphaerae bacterium]|nr:AAA family ATPase [Phycisphaerae bacterium]
MAVIESIIKWAREELPPWQGDAVRRLLSQDALTEANKDELLLQIKAIYGLAGGDAAPVPIAPNYGDTSGVPQVRARVVLKAMKGLCNVNAIPDDSNLPFGHEGLTVIYGENGAGKSGYARVLKRACKARDTKEQIHPNVFGGCSGPAAATFKVSVNDDPDKELQWQDNGTVIDVLANIAVFDSRCARVMVDEKNKPSYLPYGAHVFEGLVMLLQDLRARLERERPMPGVLKYDDISATTRVGRSIDELSDHSTAQCIERLCAWSDEENERLTELQRQVAKAEAEDPRKLAERMLKQKNRIEGLKKNLTDIGRATSAERAETLQKAIADLESAEKAVQLVSQESLAHEPLPGTGGNIWQKLYEAARAYSTQQAYPGKEFPETSEGSLCVLCMQPIQTDARARFQRFKEFMEKTTTKAADSARARLRTLVEEIENLSFEGPSIYEDALDEIRDRNPQLTQEVEHYFYAMRRRATEMITEGKERTLLELSPVTSSPAEEVGRIAQSLQGESEKMATRADPQKLAEVRSERDELQAKKLASGRKDEIIKYVENLRIAKKYDRCIDATKHTGITKRGREIISAALTDSLICSINEELKALGAQHIHINLKPSGGYGETCHQIELPNTQLSAKTKLTEIFSEGELTVVGIAGFLAELKAAGHESTIVFDDPVCSLDHRYREKVAERLANEAATRQVVVFTHDIAFLSDLELKAGLLPNVKFFAQTVRRDIAPGLCTEGLPWHSMPVQKRLSHLNEKLTEILTAYESDRETYEHEVGHIYGLLRETWEAAIEEVLFHKVVRRYCAEVHTQDLRYVEVRDEDHKRIHLGMAKCSKWMFGHDKATPLDVSRPPPSEVQSDIKELEDFVKNGKSRGEAIAARRKASLEPEPPQIG